MVEEKTFTGKEGGLPERYAAKSPMVTRVGFYNSFGTDTTPIYPNVAWAGNTVTGTFAAGADYEGRNILIHWVRASNGNAGTKEVHFFSNNEQGPGAGSGIWPTTGPNYIFSISLAASGFTGGDSQTVEIEFPIPLLVMGGCRVGVDQVAGISYSDWGRAADVEICYTVLNSTPDTASFDDLKYKYLSAFSTNGESEDIYAIKPTGSTGQKFTARWTQDIELWGGMIMNYQNTSGSSNTAKSSVRNAGTCQALCNATTSSSTNLVVDTKVGTIAIGDKVSVTNSSIDTTVAAIVAQAATTATITLAAAQSITNNEGVLFNSEIISTMAVLKGNTNAFSLDNIPHDFNFAFSTYTVPFIGQVPYLVTSDFGLITYTLSTITWQLFSAGSDTNISFYPFPVYCSGSTVTDSAGTGINNFLITSNMSDDNQSRICRFYRPVQPRGIDHGWV